MVVATWRETVTYAAAVSLFFFWFSISVVVKFLHFWFFHSMRRLVVEWLWAERSRTTVISTSETSSKKKFPEIVLFFCRISVVEAGLPASATEERLSDFLRSRLNFFLSDSSSNENKNSKKKKNHFFFRFFFFNFFFSEKFFFFRIFF